VIRNLTGKRPGKRAIIAVALMLVLSYSALTVGNSLNRAQEFSVEGTAVTLTGRGFSGDAIQSANAAAEAVAAVASISADQDRSKSASSDNLVTAYFDMVVVADMASEVIGDMFAERMVVYTARLGSKVDDVDASLEEIKLIMAVHGGFISSVNTRDDRGSVAIRVPQSRFHDAIADIEGLGEVTTRDLQGEDVSEEYVDLGAQLTTLQHQENRLYEIMEMGVNVEEVLKVERELERVRGKIESIQGRMNYLDSRVELSTITVSLFEEEEIEEVIQEWFPQMDWGVPVRTGLSTLFTITQGMITRVIVIGPFIVVGYSGVRLFRWYMAGKSVEVNEEPAAPI
jgi:hypothetical protein